LGVALCLDGRRAHPLPISCQDCLWDHRSQGMNDD
jgi:hypothetical protein